MDHHSNDLTHNLETEERCGLQPSQDATINNQQRQNSQIEMLRPSKPPPTRNHSVLGQVPQINIPRQQLPSRTHTEIQVPRLHTLSERSCYVAAPKQHCPSNRLSVNVPQLHVPAMNLGSPQHNRQQNPHQQSSSLLWQMQNQQLQRKLEGLLPSVPPVPLQKPQMPQKQALSQQPESLPRPASHFSQTSQQISRELGGSRLRTVFPEKTGDTNRDSNPPLNQVEDMNDDMMEQPRNISNSTIPMNSEIDRSIVGTPSPSLSPSSQHTGSDISPLMKQDMQHTLNPEKVTWIYLFQQSNV
ncbi:uncharacterized protein [Ptychodera flava]|uniref:uncharacterized protein n=1 Tax=Ptychodera flava TaxID=63121 RepID=UPI00396A7414